ncbi:MAG: DDE-type integrase/transposase/recombinase [Bacteroidota bacterium]
MDFYLSKKHSPKVIHTDIAAHKKDIVKLWLKGELPCEVKHRRVKYLNNPIESDHAKLKRLIKTVLELKTFQTASSTLPSFALMRMFKKGNFFRINNLRQEATFLSKVLIA